MARRAIVTGRLMEEREDTLLPNNGMQLAALRAAADT
jgi:hypothetical protein